MSSKPWTKAELDAAIAHHEKTGADSACDGATWADFKDYEKREISFVAGAEWALTKSRDRADKLADLINSVCDKLGACKHYAEMADGLSGLLPIEERVEQAIALIGDLGGYSDGMDVLHDNNDKLAALLRSATQGWRPGRDCSEQFFIEVTTALAAHGAGKEGGR